MNRIALALLFLCAACSPEGESGALDIAFFLEELASPESLCEFPDKEYVTGQVSSHDRASIYKGVDGWFANNDGFGIERTDTIDGRIEKVLFDQRTPGVITRMWITTRSPEAVMRFYFDGKDEPGIIIPAYDLMQIGIPDLGSLANPHTSYKKGVSGGSTLFFPIPYAESCKITLEEPEGWSGVPRYYHINYRSYSKGTEIRTFDMAEMGKWRRLVSRVSEEMDRMPAPHGKKSRKNAVLAPEEEISINLKANRNGSAINRLNINVQVPDSSGYQEVMGNLVVRAFFDGGKCIEAPLSSFSGAGIGAPESTGRYLRCDGNGGVDIAYLMPFRRTAEITVTNCSDRQVEIGMIVRCAPYDFGDNTLYFKSAFNAGLDLPISNLPQENYDWNFATVKGGKGVYVADVLSLFNHSRAWYGEGDEKIYVDSESKPSHFGTGTEDYYNSSWAPVVTFHTPFGGAPRADLESSSGYNTFNRIRGLDVIPFKNSFVFDLEMISWVRGTVDYFTTIFWYGEAESRAETAVPLPLDYDYPESPEDLTRHRIPGSVEFEDLVCADKSPHLQADTQDMLAFPDGIWSSGRQTLCTCGDVGDYVSYVFDDLEKGIYDISVYATKAGNYARLKFEAGGSSTDFDSWSDVVENSGKIRIENVRVDGPLTLTVRITGRNEKSAGYFFGLDCVKFDRKAALPGSVSKAFPDCRRYINIPVGKKIFGQVMTVYADGKILGRFDLDMNDKDPYMYASLDLGAHAGEDVRIEMDNWYGTLDAVYDSDRMEGESGIYKESKRPKYHFTAGKGWFNDPNGLIFHQGKYHMYFQYNPMSIFWANMSWGHAESDDLVHWEEKSPVLYPLPATGDCFTGASFVDRNNALGMNKDGKEAIVAFYLRTKSGLGYAYSLDGGRTYADWPGNPVVPKAVGRERIDSPKPVWHEKTGKWVAPVFDDRYEASLGRNVMTVSIYVSDDLLTWTWVSDIGEIGLDSECPDLFPLYLDGDKDKEYWVLVLGNAAYSVGQFDGKHFISEATGRPAVKEDFISAIPFGHYYASSTFANIPEPSGRQIQIAWMKNVFNDSTMFSGMPFNSQMSLPVELTLRSTPDGPRIFMNPVREVARLRASKETVCRNKVLDGKNLLDGISGEQKEILVSGEPKPGSSFRLDIKGMEISYDSDGNVLTVDGRPATLAPENGRISLRILADTRSVEIFGNDGRIYIPLMCDFPGDSYSLTGSGFKVKSLKVYSLDSIWK